MSVRYKGKTEVRCAKMSAFTYMDVTFRKSNRERERDRFLISKIDSSTAARRITFL
jgi:hypothetical protein